MFINKAIIYGNLTRDPELKTFDNGGSVVNFSIATNRKWKNRDGQPQEEVQFHNIVAFGKQADNIAKYMRKGSGLYIEGRLQTRSWEKDGVKKYMTEIIAENTQFGPKTTSQGAQNTPQSDENQENDQSHTQDEINPSDIPF